MYEALAAGAAGYLTKESDRDEIVAAVIKCARGEGYVPTHSPAGWPPKSGNAPAETPPCCRPGRARSSRSSPTDCRCPTSRRRLHLAPTTVRTHVQNLYAKLGVSDRAAAVAEAMRRRLVE